MSDAPDPPVAARTSAVDWVAVGWGAAVGLVLLGLAATLRAVLDREITDFDESGWELALFVLVLLAYGIAGAVGATRAAGRGNAGTPLTHGALAALGGFLAWIPVRIGIWAARGEDRGLFTGTEAALRPGQVFGQLVIAAGIGTLGGYLAGRRMARNRPNSEPTH